MITLYGTCSGVQEAVVNQSAIELLRQLPGVTDANWRSIISQVNSLKDLTDMDQQQLAVIMGGAKSAKALYDFIHAPCPRVSS